MGVVVPSVSGTNLKQAFGERAIGFTGSSPYIDETADSFGNLIERMVQSRENGSNTGRDFLQKLKQRKDV